MKRIGGLFEAIADRATLSHAAWKAAAGKRDRPEVQQFFALLDQEAEALTAELSHGTFRFGPYRTFPIRDPKTRLIRAPSFRDRVVHHAMVSILGPVLERSALESSFACRVGRGQNAALAAARRWARRGGWFLKVDIRKYYDSIPHDRLKTALARRFRERRLLDLLDRLIDSYHCEPGFGLPIGSLSSQYLGNFYLDPIDHWIVDTCKIPGHLRYMDDFLCFGYQDRLRQLRHQLEPVLEGFGLRVNGTGILNACHLGVPWLGFVVYPDRLRLNRPGRRRSG